MNRITLSILLLLAVLPALAQDKGNAEEEKSWLLTFVEDQLSTPNRRIRISGIEGVLSSNAKIGQITIADREGVWFTIEEAEIVWSRTALLTGRLEIDRLAAEKIEVARQPVPEEGAAPSPEAASFSVPELPIAVSLDELSVASLTFGEEVFGLKSELQLEGSLQIDAGTFETELNIERVDGPGGTLDLAASFANETSILDVNFQLSEPEDGVVANLLNFHDRPPIKLGLAGSGPVDDLDLALTLDAASQRVLTGNLTLSGADTGRQFEVSASGPIGQLVEPQLRDLFGDQSVLDVAGTTREAGGLEVERFSLESGALQLSGSGATAADGFPTRIELTGSIRAPGGTPVVLPVPGAQTSVRNARLDFDFGGTRLATWSGTIKVEDFSTANLTAETFGIDMKGAAIELADPAKREVTFVIDGRALGLGSGDPGLAEAIGERAVIAANGAWRANRPLTIDKATLDSKLLDAEVTATIADMVIDGRYRFSVADASVLAAATGRALSGAAEIAASGSVAPVTGAFDLMLDGRLIDFAIGTPEVDGLMAGETTINGRAARDENGISAEQLAIAGQGFSARADGSYGTERADMRFRAEVADLGQISDAATGRMTVTASAFGENRQIRLNAALQIPVGTLLKRDLRDAAISFEGLQQKTDLSGTITGDGFVGGERLGMMADVFFGEGARRLENLVINAGPSRLTGQVSSSADGLYDGALSLDSPDISTLAALLLVEARGRASSEIELSGESGQQNATIDAELDNVVWEDIKIGSGEAKLKLTDLFGVPGADGGVTLRSVEAAGMEASVLSASAKQNGDVTAFEAGARLKNETSLATAGSLTRLDDGYRLELDNADLVKDRVLARLRDKATIVVESGEISFDGVALDVSGGAVVASGSVGERIDLALDLDRVPLSVANAIRPDLGLDGLVNGSARVTGKAGQPVIEFDVDGDAVTAGALREAGLPPFMIKATGDTDGDELNVDAKLQSQNGIDLTIRGSVPLARGSLALDIGLQSFPLAVVNTAAPGIGLEGSLSGDARATGSLSKPVVDFDLSGTSISASVLRENGISALNVDAAGRYAGETVTLSSLSASGPEGLTVTANGRVPISGKGISLDAEGTVPISLANRRLAGGAAASGTLTFNARVTGSMANPAISGTLSTNDAAYADPVTNVALRNIEVTAALDGDRINISSATAAVAAGGTVTGSGSIQIDPAAGFPADLAIRFDQARYVDGSLVVATISGDLNVTGAVTRDPLVSGSIFVDRAELIVPDTSIGGADAVDVVHINPPRDVARTLALTRADDGTPVPEGRPSVARLDIAVNAPNKVFVRGRGLDSELGGTVRLTGPITDIQPVGGFELIRGRLSILGKRIVFERGRVTLVGDLDPFLDFLATSDADDVTVFITIKGRLSDPAVVFSSQPELPQDEVLSRLIFGRSIAELSALQVAKLAASVAELAGGSNGSLLGSLREATGLDELDVVTSGGDNAAVRAGRYIQDNVYFGVEAATSGDTRGTVNIDITENLKAKGSVGSDGDSSVGVFFEKDY